MWSVFGSFLERRGFNLRPRKRGKEGGSEGVGQHEAQQKRGLQQHIDIAGGLIERERKKEGVRGRAGESERDGESEREREEGREMGV